MWRQNEGTELIAYPPITPDDLKTKNAFPLLGGDKDWDVDEPRANAVEAELVDPETGDEIEEVGEVGELAYSGPMVIPGYFRQPDLTDAAFDEDWFFYSGNLFELGKRRLHTVLRP
jgi:acyl-CoA synthetase (AMP-forming)/AMP-acid ligase II